MNGAHISHMINTLKWFTYEHLNVIIGSRLKYSSHDLRDEPACVHLEGKKVVGNAMQNYTLLQFPQMVSEEVLVGRIS